MAQSPQKSNGHLPPSCQDDYADVKVEELRMGVWKVKIASSANQFGLNPYKRWASLKAACILFWDLSRRVFSISPGLFSIFLLCQIWHGMEPSLTLQLSSNLLRTIEERLTAGKSNGREIVHATLLRIGCAVLESYSRWYRRRIEEQLEICVNRHYELVLIEANLGIDLPAMKDGANKIEISAKEAWWSINSVIQALSMDVKLATELLLILHLSMNTGGFLFGLLCLLQPLFAGISEPNIWGRAVFAFVDNPHYQKMKSLEEMVTEEQYKEDLISGGLGRWIIDQFRQARQKLGITSDTHPLSGARYDAWFNTTPAFPIFLRILGELPMIFCAYNVIRHPERFSVSSLAILQQAASTLPDSVSAAIYQGSQFGKSVKKLEKIYKSTEIVHGLKSGDTPYPRVGEMESVLINPRKGMSFQLRDASFSYIGTQSNTPALSNISLTIKPGQLVVIVGANGSGKSTLIRILTRLYDPTSGTLLIDDLPSADYRIDDLHKSTVILSQDSSIYPLSLGENIGLGFPECVSDANMVSEAARLGGAQHFIEKLNGGMDTTLTPYVESFSMNIRGQKDHPLHKEMKNHSKRIDISGGEKQRVVASRSFMRFNSGKVKFVAVDEPSSALDAEGELQLFNNLLAAREGKTMIFVTHRFGHLTKHADLIICMKEGSIAESGTHAELMDKKGEYLSLYNIQAEAFRN